ncbi:MAG TPA: class I SAM-dependent methyltransferase [Dermatophilaceae bacterium]|nr:class I SAM-dependent methyltransferase [Dermatophilaceae bacterium]
MIQDEISTSSRSYWLQRRSVPGHLYDIDFLLFDRILQTQDQAGQRGDLVEVGCYLGKSAIVIGAHRRPEEDFVVCDIFEDETPGDVANQRENDDSYAGLTRLGFEANYARFVARPPTIVQGLSSTLAVIVPPATVRFAHIDGGHLYDTVKADLQLAGDYLLPDGVVAVDDVRSVHTPGVAAATWEAVAEERLIPICSTEIKLYLSPSVDTAESIVDQLAEWFSRHREVHFGVQRIRGHRMVLVRNPVIRTWRQQARQMVPPALLARLRPSRPPHLGE